MKRIVAFVLVAAALVACGDEPARPPSAIPAEVRESGPVVVADASPREDTGVAIDGTVPATDELVFVDEPDGACAAIGGSPTKIGDANTSVVHRLGRVGARRWVTEDYGRGVVLFDDSGGAPTRIHFGSDHQSDSAMGLLGIVGSERSIVYAVFAANGDELARATVADVEPLATIVGHGTSHALVGWATGTAVRLRAVDAHGALEAPFDLEAAPQSDFTGSISGQGASFGVAWSVRRTADGRYRTYFARTTTTAKEGITRLLHASATPHDVTRLVRVGAGFVVLMNVDGRATLAPLDALGRPRGPARRLVGTARALDVAARGQELAVVVRRTDGTIAVRTFDEMAAPSSGWSCTQNLPEGEERGGAIDVDETGYALVARGPDGRQWLHLLDPTGRAR